MSDEPTHLPPQNLEAEEAILGAMLRNSRAIETATDLGLRADDFYRQAHRLIFDTILETYETGSGSTDEQVVVQRLGASKQLAAAGGPLAVFGLGERTPAVANAKAYAQEVINQRALRSLVETGHEVARLGYEHPDDPPKLFAQAAELVTSLDVIRGIDDYADIKGELATLVDEWHDRENGKVEVSGLPSGLPMLDAQTGGWRPGKFVLIAGRPGMGKSSLLVQCAAHVAVEALGTAAVFSMEMDAQEILSRLVSAAAMVDGRRLTQSHPQPEDWDHITGATTTILGYRDRLRIAYCPTLTPALLRARCRKLKRQLANTEHPLSLVAVDYLQLMSPGKRCDNSTQELTYITRELKGLAMELGVPVLVASQLNREVEKRPDRRPQLSDLRDSGSIEQDADAVLLAYRPGYYWPDNYEYEGLAIVDVAKNRGGTTGAVALGWDGAHTRFTPDQYRPFVAGVTQGRRLGAI